MVNGGNGNGEVKHWKGVRARAGESTKAREVCFLQTRHNEILH